MRCPTAWIDGPASVRSRTTKCPRPSTNCTKAFTAYSISPVSLGSAKATPKPVARSYNDMVVEPHCSTSACALDVPRSKYSNSNKGGLDSTKRWSSSVRRFCAAPADAMFTPRRRRKMHQTVTLT